MCSNIERCVFSVRLLMRRTFLYYFRRIPMKKQRIKKLFAALLALVQITCVLSVAGVMRTQSATRT